MRFRLVFRESVFASKSFETVQRTFSGYLMIVKQLAAGFL
jgi:hypothetical protein